VNLSPTELALIKTIREDERKRSAKELLEAMDQSGRAVQPGLWYAATILDPSIQEEWDL
jgi:predicted transcriptional regulator